MLCGGPWALLFAIMGRMQSKKIEHRSTAKIVYSILILFLPIYAAFAVQFVPREHHGIPGEGQGWPFIVCEQVNEVGDIATLLLNATIIFTSIYLLVLASAVVRYKYFNQAPDGTPVMKRKKTKGAK